jgi:hypothetical protein
MRPLILAFFAAATLCAQDPVEIVRHAIELDKHNSEVARSYTYLQKQERRDEDTSGKVLHTESDTYDVTLLDGSPYRRLIAHNDQPLPPKDEAKAQAALQKSIEDRRRESPELRQARIKDWEHKQEKQREPLREIPEAFNLKLAGEDKIDGVATYVVDATPKPGYRPHTNATQFFPKVKARFWITKQDYQWVKVDMESLETISFLGFLVRMSKGSHLVAEATRVNNEVWLPKHYALKGSVRIALVKLIRGEYIFAFSNYKKFTVDSRVVNVGQSGGGR